MKLIGYWIQSLKDVDYYPPQEFVRHLDDEVRGALVEYLGQGEVYEAYRGRSWCRFSCGRESREMGFRELSDGYWVWPEDLVHYVRDHGVVLPEEFIRHVRAGIPRIPKDQWDTAQPDSEFWKSWCRANVSDQYRGRIERAIREADQEARPLLAAAVAEREAKEGVAWWKRCQWRGCKNRALRRRALCAACILRDTAWMITAPAYDRAMRELLGQPQPEQVMGGRGRGVGGRWWGWWGGRFGR